MNFYNGNVFKGQFKDDKIHGHGTMKYADKGNERTYEGAWENDQRRGWGKVIWLDGTIFEGEFRDDKYNGQGTYTWPDGRIVNENGQVK